MPIPLLAWPVMIAVAYYADKKNEEAKKEAKAVSNYRESRIASQVSERKNLFSSQITRMESKFSSHHAEALAFAKAHNLSIDNDCIVEDGENFKQLAAECFADADSLKALADTSKIHETYNSHRKGSAYLATHGHPYVAIGAALCSKYMRDSELASQEEAFKELQKKTELESAKMSDEFSKKITLVSDIAINYSKMRDKALDIDDITQASHLNSLIILTLKKDD